MWGSSERYEETAGHIKQGSRWFEKAVRELHIIMGWPTVVEHVRQYSTALIKIFQKFKKPVEIKDKLLSVCDKH